MDEQKFIPSTTTIPTDSMITVQSKALGVLCFNDADKRAEIGYLNTHNLYIGIWDSTAGSPVTEVPPWTLMRDKNLEILSTTSDIGERYENGSQDDKNLSRMFELTELYSQPDVGFKDNARTEFQSRFYINDSVFSTELTSVDNAIAFDHDDPDDPTTTKPERRTGRILQISTRSRNLTVRFDGDVVPLDPARSYQIVIKNGGCTSDVGDFHHYFDILKNAGNIRYNLRFSQESFLPLSEFEQAHARAMSSELLSFLENPGEDYKARLKFARQLEILADFYKCPPAACQKATFIDKSRSIPV